jgi:hypothetical protein
LIETEVLGLLMEGADSGRIASVLGRPRDEVVELIGGLLSKLDVPEPVDHPHLSPLDDDQVLPHIRFDHVRDIPRLRSLESQELARLHLLMHRESPPSPA